MSYRTKLLHAFQCILACTFVCFSFAHSRLAAQGLAPSTPAREYVRSGGQLIAVENASSPLLFVDDAGFEGSSLVPWQLQGGQASISSVAHSGAAGLTMGGTTTQSLVFQDIGGLVPGQTYQVSVWVESSTASTSGVQLWLHDTLGNRSVANSVLPGTTWQQISVAFTGTASGRLRIHLIQNSGTAETTYWDDVTVTPLPPNGDFETGVLAPWNTAGGNAAVTATPHSGVYGVTMGGTTTRSWIYQDTAGLVPGQMYQVSAWVMSSSSSTNGVELWLHDTQGNGIVGTTISPGTSWQQISTVFTATAIGKLRIHLIQLEGTAETTYWDDVTVMPLPANGDFEMGSLGPWIIAGGGATVGAGYQHSGTYGVALGGTPQDWIYQDLAGLVPGQTYQVAVWVSASTASNNGAKLWLHDTQGNGVTSANVSPNPSWQQISAAFTATSTGKLRIHLVQNAGSSATTYWDDVTIAPAGGSPSGNTSKAVTAVKLTSSSPITINGITYSLANARGAAGKSSDAVVPASKISPARTPGAKAAGTSALPVVPASQLPPPPSS